MQNPLPSTNVITQLEKQNNEVVKKNILFGGVFCHIQNSDNRVFETPCPPPYYTNDSVDVEFYLRHGENSSCNKWWRQRHFR